MLPGFRFLFAAIVLSMSILVFGLGVAALFRAAHEEFASLPSRPAPPEPVFAQQSEPVAPTLALLRVEPSVAEKPVDNVPAATAPAEQAPDTTPPVEPEKLAALKPEDSTTPEMAKPEVAMPEVAKPEIPVTETTPPTEATAPQLAVPPPADETKAAAIAETPTPANEAAPAAPEPASATPAPETGGTATKIATLGGPAVTIEEGASTKVTSAGPDPSALKKREQARRAKARRRAAQRARLAREREAAIQLQANPFSQPTITRGAQ